MTLLDAIAYATIVCCGISIPFVAFRPCPQCHHLARRTRKARHRCPDRSFSVVRGVWLACVAVWALAAAGYTVATS